MADSVAPPTEVEQPKETENKDEPKLPKLDPNKPLNQQVNKILANMPKEENAEEPKEGAEGEKEEPKKEESETPKPAPEAPPETEEEITPVEVKELPPWQKYIVDNLPNIQTVGHQGEGAKDKLFTVKRLEDLPEDFEFADRRTEIAFSAALASQEVNARELMNKYNTEQQQQQYQQFQNQEATDIQADITALQKQGVIDKFKYGEDEPEFNDDPAVKTANEIYDLYKKTNDSYLKDGRTYRITYQDAAYKYLGMKSRQAPTKEAPVDNTKERAEREKVANKVSAPSSAAPDAGKKGMPVGSTMQDVYKLYKLGRI